MEAERDKRIILEGAIAESDAIKREAEKTKKSLIEEGTREKAKALNEIAPLIDSLKKDAYEIKWQAQNTANRIIGQAKTDAITIEHSIKEQKSELVQLEERIALAHKRYKYRKTLPDSHEKLQARFGTLKEKFDKLQEDYKALKTTGKGSTLGAKEREKLLSQFDRLGRSYVEDTLKFVLSRITTNNYASSRDRVMKAIGSCRVIGFDWPDNMEEEYTEKIKEEFKRILRIEEMRLEQQRIKEQIREEEKVKREIEALRKKEEQQRKEYEVAEQSRLELERAIAKALEAAHGEHTAQILEMEKVLAEKDQEIAAKQQEIDDSQRAISNAQITKSGHVYVLSNIGSFGEGIFKIGMTRRNDPQDRVTELGDASVPFPFDVHLMVSSDNAPELEKTLHKNFHTCRVNRVNFRKEYFRVNVDDVRKCVEQFTKKPVDYVADPAIFESYAEQYRDSQNITLDDMNQLEALFEEVGVIGDDE